MLQAWHPGLRHRQADSHPAPKAEVAEEEVAAQSSPAVADSLSRAAADNPVREGSLALRDSPVPLDTQMQPDSPVEGLQRGMGVPVVALEAGILSSCKYG